MQLFQECEGTSFSAKGSCFFAGCISSFPSSTTRSVFYKGQAIRDNQLREKSFLPKSCQKYILKNKGQNWLKFHLSLIKQIACTEVMFMGEEESRETIIIPL